MSKVVIFERLQMSTSANTTPENVQYLLQESTPFEYLPLDSMVNVTQDNGYMDH